MFLEIYESHVPDLGSSDGYRDGTYHVRRAARGIILAPDGRIALLSVTKKQYHKLPGGGIDLDSIGDEEYPEGAFIRECMEETGCGVEITGSLGTVVEYRNYMSRLQISYAYTSRLVGTP